MPHVMHSAQYEDAQLAIFSGAPWFLAPGRKGDVVRPLIAQVWTVIGIVLKESLVSRPHITSLFEMQLSLLLGIVEPTALRLQMDDQRSRKIDIAVAALKRLGTK